MICLRVYVCLTINILHLEEPRQESSLRAPLAPWRGREIVFSRLFVVDEWKKRWQ